MKRNVEPIKIGESIVSVDNSWHGKLELVDIETEYWDNDERVEKSTNCSINEEDAKRLINFLNEVFEFKLSKLS